jgi:repressor of nif and glnA expression
MDTELDRRSYDLLRLVDRHGPIGSIQLVELMQLRGYDIKDRTIRLKLSELDSIGLTEKVSGKGRRLTESGRTELQQGDVGGRLEQIRARIATLTSRVSYDPIEDAGALVVSSAFLDADAVEEALKLIEQLETLPLGPIPVGVEEAAKSEPGDYRLLAPSSITLDGVLLSRGVNAELSTGGIVEYLPTTDDESPDDTLANTGDLGGQITRYVDVINGEGSSIDVISLLIQANRGDVSSLIDGDGPGLLIGDDREFPINRYEEARDLTLSTRANLGGVVDFRRPREEEGFSDGNQAWAFGSLTYVGTGELMLTALHEYGLSDEWETLYETIPRNRLGLTRASREAVLED